LPRGAGMTDKRPAGLEPWLVLIVVMALAALLSGYLTFWVQFERRKPAPVQQAKELSFQALRVKEQERKQIHDHFHLLTDDPNLEAWASKSACIVCHSPYPHGRRQQAIAVMNLHTEFLLCQSCHIKLAPGEQIRFQWVTPDGRPAQGKPYGLGLDAAAGTLAETENHLSMLAPFRLDGSVWQPAMAEQEAARALHYMQNQERYSDEQKKQLVDSLHAGTELKEFVRCSQCHSTQGIMDFAALGFEPARVQQLRKMEVGGMLTNYDTFYFPDLFQEKFR